VESISSSSISSQGGMEGAMCWPGVSGVPGLGCSVHNSVQSSSLLKLWELENENNEKEKKSFTEKMMQMFSFRKKKPNQDHGSSTNPSSSISLPKVSIRRSVSASSNRRKTTASSSERSKSNISRSVSLQVTKNKQTQETPSGTLIIPSTYQGSHLSTRTSLELHKREQRSTKKNIDKKNTIQTSQYTQTDIIEEERDEEVYDYVYSNFITPAMIIKLSDNVEEKEMEDTNIYEDRDTEDTNIYEEIVPEETKKMTNSNPLFLSISKGRR